ncbi:uncharacterized protein LOC62_07G009792 [Vanrija pseudolonga]|uniref:Uncharacterized protein n=1 Tax=Vanrija pseudolonga TaxID=143232 RepID=A0AAF1BQS3_9TREE|nr:hypothetical protein LOC62_07G009792 [Vanrija pseudolonga]
MGIFLGVSEWCQGAFRSGRSGAVPNEVTAPLPLAISTPPDMATRRLGAASESLVEATRRRSQQRRVITPAGKQRLRQCVSDAYSQRGGSSGHVNRYAVFDVTGAFTSGMRHSLCAFATGPLLSSEELVCGVKRWQVARGLAEWECGENPQVIGSGLGRGERNEVRERGVVGLVERFVGVLPQLPRHCNIHHPTPSLRLDRRQASSGCHRKRRYDGKK